MRIFQTSFCQLIATLLVVSAALPGASTAQEQALSDATSEPSVPQVRYVSDKLVLNVYAQPDQSSARVATIQTGDAVEEIERSANFVRVRLADGREGWVGANYLTSDAPAVVRLRELQLDRKQPPETSEADKKLAAEIASLKKENSSLRSHVSELQAAAAAPVAPVAETMPVGVTTAAEVVTEEAQPAQIASTAAGPWGWIAAVLLGGGLGYASGYQSLARRLRKKFGGLKIY